MFNHVFYTYVNLFTFINLLILFSILFFRKNNSISTILLAFIMIDPGLNFINNTLINSGLMHKIPEVLFLFQGTAMFYGSLIYYFTLSMLGEKLSIKSILKNPLNYFILFILLLDLYFYIDFNFFMTDKDQIIYINNLLSKEHYPEPMTILNFLSVLNWMAFFVAALIKLNKHIKSVNNYFSSTDQLKVRFTKQFLYLVIALNTFLTIAYATINTPIVEYFYIPMIVNTVYIFVVAYAFYEHAILTNTEYCNLVLENESLSRFQNLQDPLCKDIKEIKSGQNKKKYALTAIEIEETYQKILQYIKEKEPYLDPNINLAKFATALNACSYNISLTINTKFNMNFFNFVNYYRVEKAKELLKNVNELNITIDTIGEKCGFNSKSAFYRAFKKFTGKTPKEFLEVETSIV